MDIVITSAVMLRNTVETPPEISASMAIKDPVGAIGSEESIMTDFRRARDEIKENVRANQRYSDLSQ